LHNKTQVHCIKLSYFVLLIRYF